MEVGKLRLNRRERVQAAEIQRERFVSESGPWRVDICKLLYPRERTHEYPLKGQPGDRVAAAANILEMAKQ